LKLFISLYSRFWPRKAAPLVIHREKVSNGPETLNRSFSLRSKLLGAGSRLARTDSRELRAQRLALHRSEKAAREMHLGAFNSAYEWASRPTFLVQSILEIRMGNTNLIDLCSSPPFKIALVPPRKVEKVILARVVWLELLRRPWCYRRKANLETRCHTKTR
jgi:hypothetical protein